MARSPWTTSKPCFPAAIASRPQDAWPVAGSGPSLPVRSRSRARGSSRPPAGLPAAARCHGRVPGGVFTFMANATIGDGELNLVDATGELSGTKFRGGLRLHGGDRPMIELTLDSDRLDLREVIGEGSLWQSWLPSSGKDAAAGPGQDLFGQLPDTDMRVTLRVGELLLPNIPPGKLDARFALQGGPLDVEKLDFAAASTLALNRQGRTEHLRDKPSGRGGFALQDANAASLRVAAGLFGLPEGVSRSMQLSPLAPMNVGVSLGASA